MELSDFIRGKRVWVSRRNYVVAKAREEMEGAFAVVRDGREITVVIEQERVKEEAVIKMERFWRVLTFDFEMPFELVGFIAKVSSALAEEGIGIYVISTYSSDHVLVKEENVMKAIKRLREMGFVVGMS